MGLLWRLNWKYIAIRKDLHLLLPRGWRIINLRSLLNAQLRFVIFFWLQGNTYLSSKPKRGTFCDWEFPFTQLKLFPYYLLLWGRIFFFSYSPFQGVNRSSRSPRLKLRSQFDFQLLKDFASFVGPLILKTPDHQRPADTYKTVTYSVLGNVYGFTPSTVSVTSGDFLLLDSSSLY